MGRPRALSPRKAPRQERAKATMQAILEATAHVLVEEGWDHASTNRIAVRAGVSIGSLYQYFPSKEALLVALVEQHAEETMGILARLIDELRDAPLQDAVRALVGAMLDVHDVDPELHRVLTEQVPRVDGFDRLMAIDARAATLARAALEARRAELRPDVDLDVATFILTTSIEAVTHAAVLRGEVDRDALARELAELVVRYLRA